MWYSFGGRTLRVHKADMLRLLEAHTVWSPAALGYQLLVADHRPEGDKSQAKNLLGIIVLRNYLGC